MPERRVTGSWGRMFASAFSHSRRRVGQVPAGAPPGAATPTVPVTGGGPGGPDGACTATAQDVLACYRLLLGRPPDPGGWEHYRQRVAGGATSVEELVGEFLGSVEFSRGRGRDLLGGRARGRGAHEVVQTCQGFALHVDPTDFAVGHTVARTGTYEPEVSTALRSLLGPGQTFVDAGANVGWFSMLAASLVGPGGKVVAVEPNPANVALLEQSAKDNGFDNIVAVCAALADRPGAVALETDGSNGRVIRVEGPPAAPVEASFVVAARTLDHVLEEAGVPRVDVIKVDVEGAEPLVLRGGAGMFRRDRPILITEFYPLALDCAPWGSAAGYLAQLRELGYDLGLVGGDEAYDDATLMELAARPGVDHVDLLARPAARPSRAPRPGTAEER